MSKNLLVGERPVRTARQHWSVFVPVVALAIAVGAIGGLLLAVSPGSVGGHDLHSVKVFIALALVVVMLGVLLLRWMRWRFTTYMLTDRRIIVSRGILSRYMESIVLDRVQNISTTQGILGRMVRAGDVEIESAGRDGTEKIVRIYDPMGFSREVEAAVEAHRTGQPYGGYPPGQPPPGGPLPQGYVPPGGQSGYGPPPGYQPPPRGGGV